MKNTIVEYRICQKGNMFWAHVRVKKFGIWMRWKRIAKHTDGFGLYDLPDDSHPHSKQISAEKIILRFDDWFKQINQKPIYIFFRPVRII